MTNENIFWVWACSLIIATCIGCEGQPASPPCVGAACSTFETDTSVASPSDLTNRCASIATDGQAIGEPCGCGGTWNCDGQAFECNGGSEPNDCGGCTPLEDLLARPCGECGDGTWQCDGLDRLVCQRATQPDVCGGCSGNSGNPGEACGFCGRLKCDGERGLVCDDPGEAACSVTRIIAMGDTGEGNDAQYRVAFGAQERCDRAGGCSGFVMLGDNIYDTGAETPEDEQLTTKIDLPYANLKAGPAPAEGEDDNRPRMPIFVSLGNHDLGGAGLNSAQVQNYLVYAQANDWFFYPDEFWHFELGNVHLISLHTNPLAYGFPDNMFAPHSELVDQALAETTAPWTLAFGHHPYRSNGKHGNAGAYEGIPLDNAVFGGDFRRWVDAELCNRVDFYLSGHDHNRQWLNSVPNTPNLPEGQGTTPCNTHFAVSGAGAKVTDLEGRGNDTAFEDDSETGFLFMEFYRDRVEVEFCDADGNTDWSRTITR